MDAIERFLRCRRSGAEVDFDRVLATVLFTDIVGSTETAVRMADRAWNDLLAAHHQPGPVAAGAISRARGRRRRRWLLRGLRRACARRSVRASRSARMPRALGLDVRSACTPARSSSTAVRARRSPSTSVRASPASAARRRGPRVEHGQGPRRRLRARASRAAASSDLKGVPGAVAALRSVGARLRRRTLAATAPGVCPARSVSGRVRYWSPASSSGRRGAFSASARNGLNSALVGRRLPAGRSSTASSSGAGRAVPVLEERVVGLRRPRRAPRRRGPRGPPAARAPCARRGSPERRSRPG